MSLRSIYESLKPRNLTSFSLSTIQQIKSHIMTISIIGSMGGITFGVYKLAQFLKVRFSDSVSVYHQEIEDYLHDKMIREERKAENCQK